MARVPFSKLTGSTLGEALRQSIREASEPEPAPVYTKIVFEMETCSRCGGTGRYSYNPFHGDVCFKCRGRKRTFTRNGAAARKAYNDAISGEGMTTERRAEIGANIAARFKGAILK
jgi:hypothetical protein